MMDEARGDLCIYMCVLLKLDVEKILKEWKGELAEWEGKIPALLPLVFLLILLKY